MADLKISQLTGATTPVAGTEVLPIVQSSATRKVSIADLTAGRSVSASSFIPSSSTIPTNGMYLSGTNTVAWATNSSYRMSVGSGGLSINTTTSNAQITVSSSNTGTGTPVVGNSTVWLINDAGAVTANNGPAITFNARSRTGPTEIQVMAGIKGAKLNANNDEIAGYLAFYTSDNSTRNLVERARIDNLGNYVPAAAAKGVNFTANTPAAGMTSQLLNWYEEGTWTPEYTPASGSFTSISYGFRSGQYTRIGSLVYVSWRMRTSALTVGAASGSVSISGLPFAVSGTSVEFALGVGVDFGVNNAGSGRANASTSTINLLQSLNNTSIVVTDLSTGGANNFTAGFVCYRVA